MNCSVLYSMLSTFKKKQCDIKHETKKLQTVVLVYPWEYRCTGAGIDIATVAELAGCADISVIRRYT
jgi:hypothetical protein